MKLRSPLKIRALALSMSCACLTNASCSSESDRHPSDMEAIEGQRSPLRAGATSAHDSVWFEDELLSATAQGGLRVDAATEPLPVKDDSKGASSTALVVAPRVIVEGAGTFIAVSGTECVETDQGSVDLPAVWITPDYVDGATVFLNGFHFSYVRSDHHVGRLGASIHTVGFLPAYHALTWRAKASFHDDSPDETVRLCYDYTAIGWNSKRINLHVAFQEGHEDSISREDAAGHTLKFDIASPYGPADGVAILPRGFAQSYVWDPGWLELGLHALLSNVGVGFWGEDHHVLQSAYLLGQDTDLGSGVRWQAESAFHDNDDDDVTAMGSQAVVLGGTSLRIEVPDFGIRARGESTSCILPAEPQGQELTHVQVAGLKHDYVVPVLTGFSLGYHCSDHHVAQIGSQVQNARYDPSAGTLDYDVVESLADADQDPAFDAGRQVMLLNINRTDRVHRDEPVIDELAPDP